MERTSGKMIEFAAERGQITNALRPPNWVRYQLSGAILLALVVAAPVAAEPGSETATEPDVSEAGSGAPDDEQPGDGVQLLAEWHYVDAFPSETACWRRGGLGLLAGAYESIRCENVADGALWALYAYY